MRKITFLLSFLFLCIGSVSAQMFEASPAPVNGEFSPETKWYFIQFANKDDYHSNGYLGTKGSKYVNSEGTLLLNGTDKPMWNFGLWCMVGNDTGGYTFYNKGMGADKVLGFQNNLAKMYAVNETDGVSTVFDYNQSTSSLDGGPYATFKVHGPGDQYWNNSDAAPKCHLGIWGASAALSDNGSAIKITAATEEELQALDEYANMWPSVIQPTQIVDGKFDEGTQWYRLKIRNTKKTATALLNEVNSNTDGNNNNSYNGLYAFTGNFEDGYQIYNYYVGAGKGLYGVGENNEILTWSATPSTFMLEQNTFSGGFQFRMAGEGTKFVNDVQSQLGIWNSGLGAEDSGSTFVFEPVTDMETVKSAWKEIVTAAFQSEEITKITNSDGTKIGGYPEDYVSDLQEKINTIIENEETPSIDAVKEIVAFYQERDSHIKLPEAGKLYRIISAMPQYEEIQHVRKAIQNNGNSLGWATADENNTTISQIWTFTPVEGGFALQSQRDEDYPGIQAAQSQVYGKSISPTVTTLTSLGENQFNIKTVGSGFAFHTGGHSSGNGVSGNIVAWNGEAGSGSAWYIEEISVDALPFAQMKLRAFHDDNVATFPDVAEDAIEVVWPGEYKFSSVDDKADLFTHAAEIYDGTDLEAINSSLNDIRDYRNLGRKYGFPASVVMEFKAQYGTVILPSNVAIPQGVEAYSCAGVDEHNKLNLQKQDSFVSNTPYIVKGSVGNKYQLIGYDRQNPEAGSVTTGLLTGVFTETPAPEGSYVLQNQNNTLGFYFVGETQPTIAPNRCYLRLPAEQSDVRALFFGDNVATGIETATDAQATDDAPVYDLSGRRVAQPQKGIYIVGGKKIFVK